MKRVQSCQDTHIVESIELEPFLSEWRGIDGNHNNHQLIINKLKLITDWIKKIKEKEFEE